MALFWLLSVAPTGALRFWLLLEPSLEAQSCQHHLAANVKDWAVSFIAAALVVGLIIWCAKVFIGVMYG